MFQDDDHQDSSLPSIRQLFGIRASDNLDTLVSPPQRPIRANNPPPSAFPHQVVQAGRTSPRPEQRSPVRSASFSSGQVESHLPTTRGRLFAPRSTSSSSITAPYASSSRSPTVSRARQSPATTVALPPISTAIPGFIPANRGRAVSDTEAFTRGGLASSSSGPRESAPPLPIHPSLQHQHQHREDPISIDNREHHRGHVGRSPVSATTRRSQAHSISQSSSAHDHSDDPSAPSHAWTTATSRSSIEYASSSQHEYAPHPYSSASIAARQNAGLPPLPTSSSAPTASNAFTSASEGGSTHASPSRAERERVPPSAFPLYGVYSSGSSRPRSGNSSEGDESKGGFGKYECEYCSKRFNRPSSLRIHINTHTGAKPFQCPFPSCGRRFSVMSNMRRHARTHGNMLSLPAGEDPPHARGDGGEAGGALGTSSISLTNGRSIAGHAKDNDPDMDVDELEGDDEDEMDYDAGAGSSESEGYPRSSRGSRGRRPSSDDPTGHFHSF